ncbi:MAG: DUF6456 domain-containing protein [Hyphomicrobiaceae bacterium]
MSTAPEFVLLQPALRPDLAFLARLARRGTIITLATVSDAADCQRIVGRWSTEGEPRADVAADADAPAIAPEILAAALAEGFLTPAKAADCYRLSAKGRSHLRRARALASAAAVVAASAQRTTPSEPREPELNPAESPIAWLRRRLDRDGQPMLSDAQFEAGERLRADLWYGGLTPRVTQSWSGMPQSRRSPRTAPGGSATMTDTLVAARRRINRALEAIGPEHGNLLIDVCGHLRGLEELETANRWPQRSAKLMLQLALTALARHYGLLPAANADAILRQRMRHWGTDDYRPKLERWRQ